MIWQIDDITEMTRQITPLQFKDISPQITTAVGDKKVVGYFIYLPEPIIVGETKFHFFIQFHPTNEIYYTTQRSECYHILEQLWVLTQADNLNM